MYLNLIKSVRKTKKAIIVDNGGMMYGVGAEIISNLYENLSQNEKKFFLIKRIGPPDNPIPSTRALAKFCYINYLDIIKEIEKMIGKKIKNLKIYKNSIPSDQPNLNFTGPF